MTIGTGDLLRALAMGLGATLVMDLWNLFLKRAFGIASLDLCLLGRWVLHLPAGTFRHARIGAAAPQRFECGVGWLAHYSIGASLAVGFVLLAPAGWLARPTLPWALGYGLVTVVFPFFLMQPEEVPATSHLHSNLTRTQLKTVVGLVSARRAPSRGCRPTLKGLFTGRVRQRH
ncbi:MAG: DUF2938 domain-containing protein [Thermoanaerobaculia bacterium]|nr:DUF2938 domain-containing protein [Thermoanaerobaculia bacterium]